MARRLVACTTRDMVKLSNLHPDDSDFVYEHRIKNINSGFFGQDEDGFRQHFAIHLDIHLSCTLTPSLIGRWRFTFDQDSAV